MCPEVPTLKTKPMVFHKRGEVRAKEISICLQRQRLDVVYDSNYLGTHFITPAFIFALNQEHVVDTTFKSLKFTYG